MFNNAGQSYTCTLINGGTCPSTGAPGIEANLDVQYARAITKSIPNVFYSVGGSPPIVGGGTNTNEPYLEFLNYLLSLNTASLPNTVSISYGDDEVGTLYRKSQPLSLSLLLPLNSPPTRTQSLCRMPTMCATSSPSLALEECPFWLLLEIQGSVLLAKAEPPKLLRPRFRLHVLGLQLSEVHQATVQKTHGLDPEEDFQASLADPAIRILLSIAGSQMIRRTLVLPNTSIALVARIQTSLRSLLIL